MMLIQGIVSNIGTLVTTLTTTVIPQITNAFKDPAKFSEAAAGMVNNLLTGLISNIGRFQTFVATTLIPAFTNFLKNNPGLIQSGVDMVVGHRQRPGVGLGEDRRGGWDRADPRADQDDHCRRTPVDPGRCAVDQRLLAGHPQVDAGRL